MNETIIRNFLLFNVKYETSSGRLHAIIRGRHGQGDAKEPSDTGHLSLLPGEYFVLCLQSPARTQSSQTFNTTQS